MVENTHAPEFFEATAESDLLSPRQDVGSDCSALFVYGTLRRGFRLHHHLVTLGARFESDARVAGELFNMGSYPGARPASRAGDSWVVGEIFHLRNPESDLKVLDQVEGFVPESLDESEFIRCPAPVILGNEETPQTAWIYWLADNFAGSLERIPSGDYTDLFAQKKIDFEK